jgi:hypothetical protein
MDALKRYRTGGAQKIIVQHVSLNKDGQAIGFAPAKQATQK